MPFMRSQDPASFGWRKMPDADLVPFTFGSTTWVGGVARGTERYFREALTRLTRDGGLAIAAGNPTSTGQWAASNRRKRGNSGDWSFHAYGLAIDVNAPWNPMGPSVPRASGFRLPTDTQSRVEGLGLLWGGTFGDWMHLEVHISPTEVAQGYGLNGGGTPPPPPSSWRPYPLPPGRYYGLRGAGQQVVSGYAPADAPFKDGLKLAQGVLHVGADGLFGPITRAAVVRIQQAAGLTTDGLLGPRSWAALFPGRG